MARRPAPGPDQPSLFEDPPAAPVGPLVRVRMTVAYDGSRFRGFATNPGVRTVAGTLEAVISRVVGHGVDVRCAGRTDAGVHATGQVITVDVEESRLDLDRLSASTNSLCRGEIVVVDAAVAADGFDPRHDAVARTYRYLVLNQPVASPMMAGRAWHVRPSLDRRSLTLACDPLIGERDFAAFCRKDLDASGQPRSTHRRVIEARWSEVGDDLCPNLLRFEITANAFCHQMVRSIVGFHVAIGLGRRRAGELTTVMRSGDRRAVPSLAPPEGLYLHQVHYPSPDADGAPAAPAAGHAAIESSVRRPQTSSTS